MLTADEINGAKDCNELEPSERQDEHLRPSVVAVDLAPWVVVNANSKKEARLTSLLYFVRTLGNRSYVPLTGEKVEKSHSIELNGVLFKGLSLRQLAVLEDLQKNATDTTIERPST